MMIVVGKKEAAGERCGELCCGVDDGGGGVMAAVMANVWWQKQWCWLC